MVTETWVSQTAPPDGERAASAVSWGAVIAGAVAAASLSLVLLILGTGLGLSSVSPWSHAGVSAGTLGMSTIVWITLTQLLAAGAGGYLAGRLRTRWVAVHGDEVYFRDTAHGFLAWGLATLLTATLLASAVGAVLSAGAQAGGAIAGGTGTAALAAGGGVAASAAGKQTDDAQGSGQPLAYFVDSLFRRTPEAPPLAPPMSPIPPASTPEQADARTLTEVTRIYANSLGSGTLPPEDVKYLGQLVAQRTGLSQQDAEKRVADNYLALQTKLQQAETAARDAADKARKASAYTALWLVVSLLVGAFIASFAATLGGRQRDA
ncbi:hypothetical protein JQX08_19430 [Pseudomonas sp. UL073]|uniref:Transmembrane protein n=1 Tax=Zestomonas insulae TaxID=2809017 RepID=A0ABS2IJN0_9GAMM|nr:hypothetical protein [Pseudomonas insulae]